MRNSVERQYVRLMFKCVHEGIFFSLPFSFTPKSLKCCGCCYFFNENDTMNTTKRIPGWNFASVARQRDMCTSEIICARNAVSSRGIILSARWRRKKNCGGVCKCIVTFHFLKRPKSIMPSLKGYAWHGLLLRLFYFFLIFSSLANGGTKWTLSTRFHIIIIVIVRIFVFL